MVLACGTSCAALAETKAEFQPSLPLAPSDHVILDVAVPKGDITMAYAHRINRNSAMVLRYA